LAAAVAFARRLWWLQRRRREDTEVAATCWPDAFACMRVALAQAAAPAALLAFAASHWWSSPFEPRWPSPTGGPKLGALNWPALPLPPGSLLSGRSPLVQDPLARCRAGCGWRAATWPRAQAANWQRNLGARSSFRPSSSSRFPSKQQQQQRPPPPTRASALMI